MGIGGAIRIVGGTRYQSGYVVLSIDEKHVFAHSVGIDAIFDHAWAMRVLESAEGETKQVELPAAKVADREDTREMWRFIPMVPQLGGATSVRLEEAKHEAVLREGAPYYEAEVLYLHALLGHRAEVEAAEPALIQKAAGQKGAIHGRLGWAWFHLGDPKKVLVRAADEWKADTIFLGARGLHHGNRLFLGTLASAVAARAFLRSASAR